MLIVEGADPAARKEVCTALSEGTGARVLEIPPSLRKGDFTIASEAQFATIYFLLKTGLLRSDVVFDTFYPTREVMLARSDVEPLIRIDPAVDLPSHVIIYLAVTPRTLLERLGAGNEDLAAVRGLIGAYDDYIGSLDGNRKVKVIHLDQESVRMGLSEAVRALVTSGVVNNK